ncbi:hypothetical protein [Flavobacterium anhuiense]|uniref:hypothetical protein n=1 Tax=Flavobacterium anhuiense TaxID=459526 RepID=UPI00202742CD|nr:hypothetical protein [Flavobacterium anhuiense]URM35547.1 hypothetical protein LLY39_13950 [Flavobacterium anhuiense]
MVIENLIGLEVLGVNHYYNLNKMVILLENNTNLIFYNCPLVFDAGMIGKKILLLQEYKGEMSFVIVFKEMKLDVDDYNYFIIKGEEGSKHYENQIRIAFERMEIQKL